MRDGILQCKEHPQYIWTKDCRVKFDQEHIKRFSSVLDAEKHLIYLRGQVNHGTYDSRDWRQDEPLSYRSQRERFVLVKKKETISPKQLRHIIYVLEKAGKKWDRLSIKDIAEGEIEDFFDEDHGIGNKTLANWKSVLTDFWAWVVRRERRKSKIEMPEFPDIKFKMKKRMVVSMEDQADIIEEVKRISWDMAELFVIPAIKHIQQDN
jgi:hypothetical protein